MWQHLNQGEVVTVSCRCCVIDGHSRPTERSRRVLPLHPEGIESGHQELMDLGLVGAGSGGKCPIPVVAHAEHPGVITRGNQTGRGRAGRRVLGLRRPNCPGATCSGSVSTPLKLTTVIEAGWLLGELP